MTALLFKCFILNKLAIRVNIGFYLGNIHNYIFQKYKKITSCGNHTEEVTFYQTLFQSHTTLMFFIYNPHFNWALQFVHVLQPPISCTLPWRHTGQVLPTSEPIVTLVERKS